MAINGNGDSGKFSRAMSSGLIATVAWVFVLIIYCAFRWIGIEDPFLGNAFLLLTGAWIGFLTLAQGKKQARAEEKAAALLEKLEAKTGTVEKPVDHGDEGR